MEESKGQAFFDFDGTIYPKDSFLEFLKFEKGSFRFFLCLLLNSPFILGFYLKLYPNYKLKEQFFSFYFKGVLESEVKELGDKFCTEILSKGCFNSALDIISWHKENGHEVYIVTASSDLWLGNWCELNKVKLIGTSFATLDGKLTGKIEGKNCYGPEKVERIKNLLKPNLTSYGYGDSSADQFFLDLTNHPFKGAVDLSDSELISLKNRK